MSSKQNQELVEIYSSSILKLKIYQYHTKNYGFKFIEKSKPIYLPDNNYNRLVIRQYELKKDFTLNDLRRYIKIFLSNENEKFRTEAQKFYDNHTRLFK